MMQKELAPKCAATSLFILIWAETEEHKESKQAFVEK
jgi:hypothetical protein